MRRSSKIAVVGGLAAAGMMSTTAAFAADGITIGVLMPISGPVADTGLPIVDGIKLAVAEINAAGGVDGRMINIVIRDTQAKPDVGVAAAKELIAKEGAKLIIGAATSGVSLAVSEVGKQEHVVIFNPSAGARQLTGQYFHHYIFQQAPTTDTAALRDVEIFKKIGTKKICLTGFDYAYTTDLFSAMLQDLKGTGITVSNQQYLVKLDTTDYSTLISQLMADDCDTVMGTMFGGGFIAFANQAQPFGLIQTKQHFVWESNVGESDIAEALKGAYPEGMWSDSVDLWYYQGSPAHQKYEADLAKLENRKETSMWAIAGYNSVKFLAAAIKKAGSSEPDAVVTALEGLTIDSPLGALSIDAKTHQVSAPEFYGPMVTVPGSDVKQMNPASLIK